MILEIILALWTSVDSLIYNYGFYLFYNSQNELFPLIYAFANLILFLIRQTYLYGYEILSRKNLILIHILIYLIQSSFLYISPYRGFFGFLNEVSNETKNWINILVYYEIIESIIAIIYIINPNFRIQEPEAQSIYQRID